MSQSPLPPPPPIDQSIQIERAMLRMLEIKVQMKNPVVAVMMVLGVPVFGGFYASPLTGYCCLIAEVVCVVAFLPHEMYNAFLFFIVTTLVFGVFSALKRVRLHNLEILAAAAR